LAWQVKVTEEYAGWFTALMKEDLGSAVLVAQAVAALREDGPSLHRPLVERLKGSKIHHLKELRPGSRGVRRSGSFSRSIRPVQHCYCWAGTSLVTGSAGIGRTSPSLSGSTLSTPRMEISDVPKRTPRDWEELERELHAVGVSGEEIEAGARKLLALARGTQLADARKQMGLTQREIAAELGVSIARVSQIEHGEVTSFEIIARYVEALGGRLDLVADFGDRTVRLPVTDTGHAA
jgi:DNA-binding XRE family transcriptional regulator